MKSKSLSYTPIVDVRNVDENRDVVVSRCEGTNGYTIAQKMTTEENGKKFSIFLKNAIHVCDLEALEALAEAMKQVVDIEKKANKKRKGDN